MLRRILLLVSYDGSDYSGFAPQINAPTISNALIDALRDIDPDINEISGSSRTDAGVHALTQPASFVSEKGLSSRGWVLAMAHRLPRSITIASASFVPLHFNARRDPLWKLYLYRVFPSQVEDPFLKRVAWRVGGSLDLPLMRSEANDLLGEHDFSAFRSIDDKRFITVRRIDTLKVEVSKYDPRVIDIEVTGNRFLHNMVRIIAGTLVDVGRHRLKPGAAKRAIASGDRRDLGMTAPPQGLTLAHVELQTLGTDTWPPSVATSSAPPLPQEGS